jgi:hypothetical protein
LFRFQRAGGFTVGGGPPDLVAINHDEYYAKHVGHTADGRQFFLTNPFVPAAGGSPGGKFIALYLFNVGGRLLEAMIDAFGARAAMNEEERRRVYQQRRQDLCELSFDRIEVAPFAVERFGTTFRLVPREPEHEDDPWVVEVQPGNHMAFFEPWESGDYDT